MFARASTASGSCRTSVNGLLMCSRSGLQSTNLGFFDDVPDHTTAFWGGFASRPWTHESRNVLDVYYYGLDRKNAVYNAGSGHELRHTVGARIASHDPASMEGRTAIPHFDVEGVYQFGSFATDGFEHGLWQAKWAASSRQLRSSRVSA